MGLWNLQLGLFIQFCKSQGVFGKVKGAVVGLTNSNSDPSKRRAVEEELVWAERGRTRALMYQLERGSLSQKTRDDEVEMRTKVC